MVTFDNKFTRFVVREFRYNPTKKSFKILRKILKEIVEIILSEWEDENEKKYYDRNCLVGFLFTQVGQCKKKDVFSFFADKLINHLKCIHREERAFYL